LRGQWRVFLIWSVLTMRNLTASQSAIARLRFG
jgi:hypothetical protein